MLFEFARHIRASSGCASSPAGCDTQPLPKENPSTADGRGWKILKCELRRQLNCPFVGWGQVLEEALQLLRKVVYGLGRIPRILPFFFSGAFLSSALFSTMNSPLIFSSGMTASR